jgi:hypothetical protein
MYCDLWISTFKKEYFPRKLFVEIRYAAFLFDKLYNSEVIQYMYDENENKY